ncbi:MAG TPA: DNA polymerase III subunit gamma/tau [Candidatus Tripitaka californicus]|uniref:DNA polymerase III subunit gamma/tau n=1 Tax=Candidatus Tripitaka californicus TaxID=3367616 RepID=UPI004028038D
MTYTVFARKYRPQTFEEVVGQEATVTTLRNAIAQGRVAHAYLFAGPRGVGKTSIARILAKCLNCQQGTTDSPCDKCDSCRCISEGRDLDVIEIDGASNRSIDDVRTLRENVKYLPSRSRHKVYIIDEAHMLTKEAFNALLKTLEEPPPHVKFFFATTAPNKLPETILSRCQRFDFKNISLGDIVNRLQQITKKEGIKADEEALRAIARYARGGLRDSQSLLDQLWAFSEDTVTVADVQGLLGAVPEEGVSALVERFIQKDAPGALKIVNETLKEGKDWATFIDQTLWYLRDLLVVSTCGYDQGLLENPWREAHLLKTQSQALSQETLMAMIQTLTEVKRKARDDFQQRVFLEMAVVKLATMDFRPLSEVLSRLEELEKRASAVGYRQSAMESSDRVAGTVPVAGRPANKNPLTQSMDSKTSQPLQTENQGPPPKDIGEVWTQVLERLHREKLSTWSYLKEGRLRQDGEQELVLEFPRDRPFPKKYLETNAQERTVVEEYLADVLGWRPRLKFTLYERVVPREAIPKDTLASVQDTNASVDILCPLTTIEP